MRGRGKPRARGNDLRLTEPVVRTLPRIQSMWFQAGHRFVSASRKPCHAPHENSLVDSKLHFISNYIPVERCKWLYEVWLTHDATRSLVSGTRAIGERKETSILGAAQERSDYSISVSVSPGGRVKLINAQILRPGWSVACFCAAMPSRN